MADELTSKLLAAVMDPERLYNQAPCGYITFLVDGTIIKINDTLLHWLGYAQEEVVNRKKFSDLLSKGGQIHFEMFFRPMLGVSGGAKELAYELLCKNGKIFHVLFGAISVKDQAGHVLAVNGIFTDNTDRKRYEQELVNSKNRADQARKELGESYSEQQALNEELAAINEELTTTNEDLNVTQATLQQMVANFEESESRLRSLVESAPFPIGVYVGAEMRILLANQNIMDVWGKGNDVIGKTYKELLPELRDQAIFLQLDQVFSTGKPYHARNQRVEIINASRNQEYYFNYSFTPLSDHKGQVYGVMNTAADVTDLNVAKRAVERNERNLNAMILQAPVAMCILLGPDHIIQVANLLMIKLWGKPVGDVMNKPLFDALPDARGQGLEKIMADVYNTGENFTTNEMPVTLLRNGKEEVVYQNFVYEPFKDVSGTVIGVIAITIDVTEQVMARKKIELSEKELRKTKDQLELQLEAGKKVQRQKDDFIGMASHELKTPLTSLTAIIQVANRKLRESADPFLIGAMDKAQVQVKRMTSMINGFLNISRLESGKMLIEKKRFNLDRLIQEMMEEIQMTAPDHFLRLNDCDNIAVHGDPDKIGSVLTNLMSNAVKYSPKGKHIEIAYKVDNEMIEVSVRDEGMGIKQSDADKIFDRYYRVESVNTRHIAGFGIGLYLSAEIIERHHGRIWVQSEPGHGSTFYFTLPLADNSA